MALEKAFVKKERVPKMLFELKNKGILTGILTSDSYERTIKSLNLINVNNIIDFIFTPEKVDHGKPDIEMIEKTCNELDIHPSELMVIGDSVMDFKNG